MAPPRQVYGKRPRAVYDPFQAFVSPQRPAPKTNIKDQGIFVAEVVEELSRLTFENNGGSEGKKSGRKALRERSANEVVEPVKVKVAAAGGKTRRSGRKVVDEDDDKEIENRERTLRAQKTQPKEQETGPTSPRRKIGRSRKKTQAFVADNVPMFIDDHGYDTEDEYALPHLSIIAPTTSVSTVKTIRAVPIIPSAPPSEDDSRARHCAPLLELSSHDLSYFSTWTDQLTSHFTITKIAEASFGEVYRLSLLEDLSSFTHADESVLKIIALKPPFQPKTKGEREKVEAMSSVEDVANEVRLLQRMTSIPGFTNFRDVRLLRGRPPPAFTKAYRDFNAQQQARKKTVSAFPDPSKKSSYPDDQLWAVIEMQDAGTDLERYIECGHCGSIWSVWDVFWQVTLALGKGEEACGFEHRDLHLGNICIRAPSKGDPGGREEREEGEGIETKKKLGFTTLEATVIDYTISRALLTPITSVATKEGHVEGAQVAYTNLSLPSHQSVFEGDSTEEYQYDIYRYMRGCVLHSDPHWNPPCPTSQAPTRNSPAASEKKEEEGAEGGEQWRHYNPKTNLLWLHYLLHSLLEQLSWPSSTKAPPKKRNAGRDHAGWKRANDLEHILLRVQDLLDPAVICASDGSGLASAGSLVGLALEEGWLDVEDVVGCGDDMKGDEEELVDGWGPGKTVIGEGETLALVEREEPAQEEEEVCEGGDGRTRRKR